MTERNQNTRIKEELAFDVCMGSVRSAMPLPAGQDASIKS